MYIYVYVSICMYMYIYYIYIYMRVTRFILVRIHPSQIHPNEFILVQTQPTTNSAHMNSSQRIYPNPNHPYPIHPSRNSS